MENNKTAEKILKHRAYLTTNVARFFSGPQGAAALKALEELYCRGSLLDSDPIKMAANVGQHDLIMLIKQVTKENS